MLNAGLRAELAGDTTEATTDYNKALASDPKNKYAYYNLGLIAQQQGRVNDAETNYRSALIIDPDYQPALYNLAIVLVSSDPWAAIDLYRQLIELNPKNATAYNNLGYALKTVGQTTEGDAAIATARGLDPSLAPTATPSP